MLTQSFLKSSCLAVASFAAFAGPLEKNRIASDAKWFVHIDVEGLRNSALGTYVLHELVEPQLEKNDQLRHANLSMNISNINSITAYGPSFDQGAQGVLMVSTSADPRKDLDTVAGMFLASAGTNAPFTMIQKDPLPLYSFSKAVYFAPVGHTLFVAKSREQIEHAHEVCEGKAESLVKGSAFKGFREPPHSFFSAAVADGFIGQMGIPPQAQVLRETTGGRFCLGEHDKNVFVNLSLQGKDDMATTRIQQVLQGLVALASLTQQNDEITALAGGTKIAAEGSSVTVNLEYPVDKTIARIKEQSGEDHAHGGGGGKAKAKIKRKKHAQPADDQGAPDEQPPSKELDKPEKSEKAEKAEKADQ